MTSSQLSLLILPQEHRKTFIKLDVNEDFQLNNADREALGISEPEFEGIIAAARLCMDEPRVLPRLNEKKVVISGAGRETLALKRAAEELGAILQNNVNSKTDLVFIGDENRTRQDEKAHLLKALQKADLEVFSVTKFKEYAILNNVLPKDESVVSKRSIEKRLMKTTTPWFQMTMKPRLNALLKKAVEECDSARATHLKNYANSLEHTPEFLYQISESNNFDDTLRLEHQYTSLFPFQNEDGFDVDYKNVGIARISWMFEKIETATIFFDKRNGEHLDVLIHEDFD